MALKMLCFALFCCGMAAGAAPSLRCSDDAECAAGSFCYISTGRCTHCVDCSAYQRQPAATCAREPAQCGDCVAGFEPEILTNGHSRNLCIRSENSFVPTVSPPPTQFVYATIPWWFYAIFGVCFCLGVFVFFIIQKKYRQCLKVQWQTQFLNCNDSQTSLSTPFAPTAPPQSHAGDAELSRDEAEARMFNTFFCEREDEKCQKASKFLNPVWVRDPHNNNNNPENVAQDVVDGPVETAPFLIDENTLPSDWTPGAEYDGREPAGGSSSETPLITSFAGILQLNALANGPPPTNHTAGANAHDSNESANAQGQQQHFVNVTNNIVINNGAPNVTGIFNITKT